MNIYNIYIEKNVHTHTRKIFIIKLNHYSFYKIKPFIFLIISINNLIYNNLINFYNTFEKII